MLRRMRADGSNTVLAVDMGGDKLVWSRFNIRPGSVKQAGNAFVMRAYDGSGYLDLLEDVAVVARKESLTVGISLAGPTEGTRLVASPNLGTFTEELYDRYGGDFTNLFQRVKLANDAEAGIMAASLEAVRRHPDTRDVIYVINGSGVGGAVLRDGTIYATEPGHVELHSLLNRFNQTKICGLFGAEYVCVDHVAASRAGIEDIWYQQTGKQLTGIELSQLYRQHNLLAIELYDGSAVVMAHVIAGIVRAFALPRDFSRVAVVCHGGIFGVEGYGDRLLGVLAALNGRAPKLLLTSEFSQNACLDGAAIAAIAGLAEERN